MRLPPLLRLGLLVCFGAASLHVPAAETAVPLSVLLLVEHDPFTLACTSDPKVPAQQGHGFGYTWRRYALMPGATYELRGGMGWTARLDVGAKGVTGASLTAKGPHLAAGPQVAVAEDGAVEVRFGVVPDFEARIPLEYGHWDVPGAYAARPGHRRLELPDGVWELRGTDWRIPLRVAGGRLQAAGEPAGLAATAVALNDTAVVVTGKPVVLPPPIAAPPAGPRVTVTRKDTAGNWRTELLSLEAAAAAAKADLRVPPGTHAGLGIGGGYTLLCAVRDDPRTLTVTPALLAGGKGVARFETRLRALDEASTFPERAVQLNPGKTTFVAVGNAPPGVYELRMQGLDIGGTILVQSLVLLPHVGASGASLWFPAGRSACRDDEPLEVAVWLGQPTPMELTASQAGCPAVPLATLNAGGMWTLAPFTFAPGDVTLTLTRGADVLARRQLTVVASARPSSFPVLAYGQWLGTPGWREDLGKMQRLGIRGCIDRGGTALATEARLEPTATVLATLAHAYPETGPADRYAPAAAGLLAALDRLGWSHFAQWACAHQPWANGISWRDPVVSRRLAATSSWMAMNGRAHPGFLGIDLFDEGGTARGPRTDMDGTWIEYEHFRQAFGRAKPRFFDDDEAARRAWIYDKQEQMDTVYRGTAAVLDEMNRLAGPGAHLFLGTQNGNLNSMAVDGGHPPLAYRALTFSTMHYYPVRRKAFTLIGNEYHFMLPDAAAVPFCPLLDADGHPNTSAHEVALMLSRQVDGVAYFHWDSQSEKSMMPAAYQEYVVGDEMGQRARVLGDAAKEGALGRARSAAGRWQQVNRLLETHGDFFRAIRRERRAEVGVLCSLFNIAPRLYPKRDDPEYAHQQAWHAAGTLYYATVAILRAGHQAGWLSEEEILERDGLAGRRVVVLADVTALKPGLRERLEAFVRGGGTVFCDEACKVTVTGARPLPLDFAHLWAESTYESTAQPDRDSRRPPRTWLDTLTLGRVVPIIQDQFASALRSRIDTSAPLDFLLTRQVNGDAVYYLGVSQKYRPVKDLPPLTAHDRANDVFLPLDCRLRLPVTGMVYDLLNSRLLGRATAVKTIDVKLAPGELAVYAILPDAPGRLELTAAAVDVAAPGAVALHLRVLGAAGQLLSAALPLEVQVLDAQTAQPLREPIYRSTDRGEWSGSFAPGVCAPPKVRIRVRERLTGKEASVEVAVRAAATVAVAVTAPVEIERERAVVEFLQGLRGRAVFVALDESTDAAAVQPLVTALQGAGAHVLLRRASQLTGKTFDTHVGRGVYRVEAALLPGAETTPEIDAPVIAVGLPWAHALIRHAAWERQWTGRLTMGGYPGPGRAYITHLWRAFSLTDNSVLVTAGDDAGLRAGIAALAARLASPPPARP